MSVETDRASATSPESSRDDAVAQESLTDMIDRMDREAFRRSLEQRDLRLLSANIERRR
jgi:hypothetical protein